MAHIFDCLELQGKYAVILASSGSNETHRRLEHVLLIDDVNNSLTAFYVIHVNKSYIFEKLDSAVDFYNSLG